MKKTARKPLRILVTDDHATTRLGIKQILKEEFRGAAFGEAADAAGTLQQVDVGHWDLLILDISLPDRDGLSVLREVKQRRPELPVLVFSVHPEDQFAMRALKFHAAGYLTKERAPEELAALAGVEWVVGNSHKSQIAELVTVAAHSTIRSASRRA